jgi:hypothetical protein
VAASWTAEDLLLRLVAMWGYASMGLGMETKLYEVLGMDVGKRLVWLQDHWCSCCVAIAAAAAVEEELQLLTWGCCWSANGHNSVKKWS